MRTQVNCQFPTFKQGGRSESIRHELMNEFEALAFIFIVVKITIKIMAYSIW